MVGGSAGYMQGSAGYLVVHKVIIVSVRVLYVGFSVSLVFGFSVSLVFGFPFLWFLGFQVFGFWFHVFGFSGFSGH